MAWAWTSSSMGSGACSCPATEGGSAGGTRRVAASPARLSVDPASVVGRQHDTSVIAAGDAESVLTAEHVREAYGVDVDLIEHAHRRLIVPID